MGSEMCIRDSLPGLNGFSVLPAAFENELIITAKEILKKALNGSGLPINKLLGMRENTVIITDQDI